MAEPMLITVTGGSDGPTVVAVHGDVDIATADQLREQLLLAFARHPDIVLDLSQAMFFDVSGLRALSAVHRQAVRQNRPAPTLRGVRPLLAKMLKSTGLDRAFTIERGITITGAQPATAIGSRSAERDLSAFWVERAHQGSHRALAGAAA